MTTKGLLYFFLAVVSLNSCSKNDDDNRIIIDVSQQWTIDPLGNLMQGPVDNQWHSMTFNTEEMNLFNSLDTANLVGTTKPNAVIETTGNYIYPNPYIFSHNLSFQFSNGYSGNFVLKVVYVDNFLKPLFKASVRLHSTSYPSPAYSNSQTVSFQPAIPPGKFRLYYTLSSENNPHFYKSWGNIQKTQ